MNQQIKDQLDSLFDNYVKDEEPGLSIKVIKDDMTIYNNQLGLASLEYGIPIHEKTVFNIGSISKQFTATVIALLEESGQLKLTDSIKCFLPELPMYCDSITVADLVFMRNGIRDFYHMTQFMMGVVEDDFVNHEEVIKLLSSIEEPMFESGTQWSYGNTGYYLLSVIIERITGRTLAEVAQERIFDVLGMTDTFFRNDRTKIIKNRAYGYCRYDYLHPFNQNEGHDKYCVNNDQYELTGPGQVWTTMEDLMKWDANFLNNQLGKQDQHLIKKLMTSGILKDGTSCNYGYGLFLNERKGFKQVYHGGSTAGFLSVFYKIPSENLTIFFLSNSNFGYYELSELCGMNLEHYIADLVLGLVEVVPKVANNEQQDHLNLTNTMKKSYQCPKTSSIWEVRVLEDRLVVDENRNHQFSLFKINHHEYASHNQSIRCEMLEDQLIVYQNDQKFNFYPFIRPLIKEELEEYVGDYYCGQLDTTFTCRIEDNHLSIKNRDRHRNGIDFLYNSSIKDHFINFNPYSGSMMITFLRESNGQIQSFVYRDYDGDQREKFQFIKLN